MTPTWLPIRYRDFYDVPRALVVEYRDHTYLFDCLFDYDADDYESAYTVYRLPAELAEDLDTISWTDLGHQGSRIGRVEVSKVELDATKRAAMDGRVFDLLDLER